MPVAIIDPLLRGLNDHHWSHIEACATYCRNVLGTSPTLYLPDDASFTPDGGYQTRRVLKRPQYSSYNELPLEEYFQFLVWFDQAIKPSLRQVLTDLEPDVDLIVPNCTLPLLYSLLGNLKQVKALRSIRLYMVQVFLPSEPGLGIQLIRTFLERVCANSRVKEVLVALPRRAHVEISQGSRWAFWGDHNRGLWSLCKPVLFNPLSPEILRGTDAEEGRFDIVFFGHPNPEKNDFSGLLSLLNQGLSLSICIPRKSLTQGVSALVESLREGRSEDVVDLMIYDELSSTDFVKLASRGRFSYLVSFGDYYSSKGGYSNRVLEALVSATPVIASPDAFQHVPFFDAELDAIVDADSKRLQDPVFCSELARVVKNDHITFRRRALSRRDFWRRAVVEFGFEHTFLSDFRDRTFAAG